MGGGRGWAVMRAQEQLSQPIGSLQLKRPIRKAMLWPRSFYALPAVLGSGPPWEMYALWPGGPLLLRLTLTGLEACANSPPSLKPDQDGAAPCLSRPHALICNSKIQETQEKQLFFSSLAPNLT